LNLFYRAIVFPFTVVILFFLTLCLPRIASPQTTDVQAAYEQAVELLRNGKNAEAMALVEAVIDAGARDPSLYNLKGLAASELGRNQEAEESFRILTRLAPRSAIGYNNLGVLFSKLGRDEEAATAFREAQMREPENFTALLGLGTSLVKLHKYAEAATYLQRAWNIRTKDFQAGYEWALALREAKQAAAAKKVLNQLSAPQDSELAIKYYSLAGVVGEDLNDAAAASESYHRALALNPNSYEIYLALVRTTLSAGSMPPQRALPSPPQHLSAEQNLAVGLLFVSHGLYEEAIPRFEETVRQDPSSEAAILNLAQAYSNAGKASAAIDLIRRTLEGHPLAALYNMLAGLQEESGQYVEAVQSYQHAVELDPAKEQYYFDLGMEYLSHFTFGPAGEVFRVATQKFPNSSRQYLGLAFSHYAVREYVEAADAFTTALEIEPDSPAVFQAWKTVLSFLAPKDFEGLLPRLDRLDSKHPQSAELAFCYGTALFRSELAQGQKGTLDRPQILLEKSVGLQPKFSEAHLELGSLYAARKQDQKAVDEYLTAIRQNPNSDIAHYRLGQVYREMNRLDSATQELARYQELARLHEDELKRNRSTIKQFVLSQPAKAPGKSND
jgi:tetratricopeptide (TPR) repeat protein